MAKIMLGGSATITYLPAEVQRLIDEFQHERVTFLVGDCRGIDTEFQRLFMNEYSNVMIYHSGAAPRYRLGKWECVAVDTPERYGTRKFYTAKDIAMCEECTAAIFVWDGFSRGTLRNILSLKEMGKRAHVYRTDRKEWED